MRVPSLPGEEDRDAATWRGAEGVAMARTLAGIEADGYAVSGIRTETGGDDANGRAGSGTPLASP